MSTEPTIAERDAYQRGLHQGKVDALLDDHTRHLARINGSLERFADELVKLTAAIGDDKGRRVQAEGEAIAVNQALKDAVADQTSRTRARWSRREKVVTVIAGALLSLAAAGTWLYPHPF